MNLKPLIIALILPACGIPPAHIYEGPDSIVLKAQDSAQERRLLSEAQKHCGGRGKRAVFDRIESVGILGERVYHYRCV